MLLPGRSRYQGFLYFMEGFKAFEEETHALKLKDRSRFIESIKAHSISDLRCTPCLLEVAINLCNKQWLSMLSKIVCMKALFPALRKILDAETQRCR